MATDNFHAITFGRSSFIRKSLYESKSIATAKSLLISLLIFVASLGVVVIDRSIFTYQVLLTHAEGRGVSYTKQPTAPVL